MNIEDKLYDRLNKKRINNKESWLKILNNKDLISENALEVLFYLYNCKNYTTNCKIIANYFNTDTITIINYIASSGRKIVKYMNLQKQMNEDGTQKLWNIFFETVPELNTNSNFTWKLREELVEALAEKFDLIKKEEQTIDEKIKQFIEDYPYNEFVSSIQEDLEARDYFVNRFTINNIMSMTIDDFVIGKADIDEKGRNSFCYLIERTMQHLGGMRGSFVSKFGIWYSKEDKEYKFTKKYGKTLNEAFENLKKEISLLLILYIEQIKNCEIANIFKGKLLSTYYPEKYLCIFDENDIDKFLNLLNIKYDLHQIDTLEKKKELLKQYKEQNELLKNYSDYYYMMFLYRTFRDELKINNTITGEIDYNIKFVNFDYLKKHEIDTRNSYRSRSTDYERINRNKKDVGNRGENAIFNYEVKKLKELGLNELAKNVCICDNDAQGYDIISFDEYGKEIHIEVKNSYLDFYITENELKHLKEEDNYYIYYLFNIKKGEPKCHIINRDAILKKEKDFFQPVIYKVNIDVLEKK